jgi:hypothetical protein
LNLIVHQWLSSVLVVDISEFNFICCFRGTPPPEAENEIEFTDINNQNGGEPLMNN